MITNPEQVVQAADKVRRLASLNELYDDLRDRGDTLVGVTVSTYGLSIQKQEDLRADRLLRAVAEEINDIVDELAGLGIQGPAKRPLG